MFNSTGGITPAHAGKTRPSLRQRPSSWDHPRACGENSSPQPRSSRGGGSPPRMRGKRSCRQSPTARRGITPAHAGKTALRNQDRRAVGDHPRACGENTIPAAHYHRAAGSPPRMRGKHSHHEAHHLSRGITPAHAGKTTGRGYGSVDDGDHPRACGENPEEMKLAQGFPGSPPRMRGKLLVQPCDCISAGITPAHAGKTRSVSGASCHRRDHPRACGENCRRNGGHGRGQGSPPRMRGKHFGKGVFPWLILVLSLDPL